MELAIIFSYDAFWKPPIRTSLNQLIPATMLQNTPNWHILFLFFWFSSGKTVKSKPRKRSEQFRRCKYAFFGVNKVWIHVSVMQSFAASTKYAPVQRHDSPETKLAQATKCIRGVLVLQSVSESE